MLVQVSKIRTAPRGPQSKPLPRRRPSASEIGLGNLDPSTSSPSEAEAVLPVISNLYEVTSKVALRHSHQKSLHHWT